MKVNNNKAIWDELSYLLQHLFRDLIHRMSDLSDWNFFDQWSMLLQCRMGFDMHIQYLDVQIQKLCILVSMWPYSLSIQCSLHLSFSYIISKHACHTPIALSQVFKPYLCSYSLPKYTSTFKTSLQWDILPKATAILILRIVLKLSTSTMQ